MKTLFILSLIAISTSQAYAAPSDAELMCAAGVAGASVGTALGTIKRPDMSVKYTATFLAATSVGACALGAGIMKGAEALRESPNEQELQQEEPAQDSE